MRNRLRNKEKDEMSIVWDGYKRLTTDSTGYLFLVTYEERPIKIYYTKKHYRSVYWVVHTKISRSSVLVYVT